MCVLSGGQSLSPLPEGRRSQNIPSCSNTQDTGSVSVDAEPWCGVLLGTVHLCRRGLPGVVVAFNFSLRSDLIPLFVYGIQSILSNYYY